MTCRLCSGISRASYNDQARCISRRREQKLRCSFDVYLLFIATINSKKLPKATNSSSLRNGLDKPLFEIAEDHGEADSPFETDRGCIVSIIQSIAMRETAL